MKAFNKKMTKLALRYVIPYFIILSISLLTGYIVYNKTSDVLQSEIEKSNIVLLEQGMTVLDNRMKEMDLIIRRITNDTSVIRLQQIYEPYEAENLYKIIETQKRLKDYNFLNNFISQYFIFFKNGNLVLNGFITEKIPEFHRVLQYEDQDEDFFQQIVNQYHYKKVYPVQEVQLEGRKINALTYVHSFGFSQFSKATIILLLNYEEIGKLFQGMNISGGGWAYIADEEGHVISMAAEQPIEEPRLALPPDRPSGIFETTIDSRPFVVTYVTSDYNGWTYVAAQPAEIVMEKINYIKRITFFIFYVFLFVGILLALYIAYRNSKPVHALMQTNVELQEKIERQLPYIQSAFFERLLKGELNSANDIQALMKYTRIDVGGKYFVASIIYIREDYIELNEKVLERLAKKKLFLKDAVARSIENVCFVHDVDEDKIALVFSFELIDKEDVVATAAGNLAKVQHGIHAEHQIISICSLGNVYDHLLDISRSFYEAEQALVQSNESRLILYEQIYQDDQHFFYPENMELQIMSCIKSGNEKQLNILLSELYKANFMEKSLPVLQVKIWLFDMWASLVKIAEQVSIEEVKSLELLAVAFRGIDSKENLELNYQQICKVMINICRLVDEKKKGNKSLLFGEIKAYIDDHYHSSDLSLTMVADQFNLSEAYLSRTFKEQTGATFFDYLEHRRLERTKQLLSDTELSISQIATSVGYNSLNTFGRAFKRATGITAKAYRELNRL